MLLPEVWARAEGNFMHRRQFLQSSSAAAAVTAPGQRPAAAVHHKRALMRPGCQSAPTNQTHLKYFAPYGVRDISGYPTIEGGRVGLRHRGRADSPARFCRRDIEGIAPPILTSRSMNDAAASLTNSWTFSIHLRIIACWMAGP